MMSKFFDDMGDDNKLISVFIIGVLIFGLVALAAATITHESYDCSKIKHKEKLEFMDQCTKGSKSNRCKDYFKEMYCQLK